MLKMTDFASHRKQLMKQIDDNSVVIISAAPSIIRNGDYTFPYRQNSDFYYLTGFEEPEAILVLAPKRKAGEFILFNRVRDRAHEIWEGLRAGQEGACKSFGANESFPITEFENKLPGLLEGRNAIHYSFGADKAFDECILGIVNKIRSRVRNGIQAPIAFVDLTDTLHEMRLIKSPAEIAVLRKSAEISAEAHNRAMQACKPGMYEYQLEAELLYEFNRNGSRFPAYSSIVGSGRNSCILHYCENNKKIQKDDIVLIDAGGEHQYYASDITRTFPASGRFSAEQRAIYELVLESQLAGIKAIKPGVAFPVIQSIIVKILTQGLIKLGLLKGNLKELIESQAYFKYYMHKSGHWVGLDVHDVGRYKINNKWRTFKPGMVLTVEPGLYLSEDIAGLPKRWHNIGVRIEDDILVTKNGHEVLSHGTPKTVAAIEALMAK